MNETTSLITDRQFNEIKSELEILGNGKIKTEDNTLLKAIATWDVFEYKDIEQIGYIDDARELSQELFRICTEDDGVVTKSRRFKFISSRIFIYITLVRGSIETSAANFILEHNKELSASDNDRFFAYMMLAEPLKQFTREEVAKKTTEVTLQALQMNAQGDRFAAFMKDYESNVSLMENQIQSWKDELKHQEEFATKLQTKFSFVGMSEGLADAMRGLEKSINGKIIYMVILMVILCAVPIIGVVAHTPEMDYQHHLMLMIPFIALEGILIYVYRIIYAEYRMEKTHLSEISYRHILCAFSASFSKFKKDNPHIDLAKFERLIFSSLPNNTNYPNSPLDDVKELIATAREIQMMPTQPQKP